MEKFIRINVVFEVPSHVAERAVALSKELKSRGEVYFTLDASAHYPLYVHTHITLYAPEYPEHNVQRVIETAKRVAQESQLIEFKYVCIGSNDEGYVVVHFELTPAIRICQENFVEALHPLREGRIRPKLRERMYSKEQNAMIIRYGTPQVLEFYKPHITLTRFTSPEKAQSAASRVMWPIQTFSCSSIGIYESGEHGTLKKPLGIFDFAIQ